MQARSHNAEELKTAAAAFLGTLSPGERATIITLSGDLGAGKTTFTQGIAAAFGITETVTSPTFVIEKVYILKDQKWDHLIHIDAYRLNNSHELEVLGWAELSADPKSLIVLEWPEKVAGLVPHGAHALRFDIDGDTRIIRAYGEEAGR